LALALKRIDIEALLVDGAYPRLKAARMEGLEVYYGEILSEHAEHTLEAQHLSYLLCATDNDFYNALVCKAQGRHFGHHRSLQLAIHQESSQELKRLIVQQRGHIAFNPPADFETLNQRLAEGWTIQTTKLRDGYDWEEFTVRMGEPGGDWLLLGGIAPDGELRLYSNEQPFALGSGWAVLYFAPEYKREAKEQPGGAAASPNGAPSPSS
jgi:CPA1 family monovalent cation:H+ antiporter